MMKSEFMQIFVELSINYFLLDRMTTIMKDLWSILQSTELILHNAEYKVQNTKIQIANFVFWINERGYLKALNLLRSDILNSELKILHSAICTLNSALCKSD